MATVGESVSSEDQDEVVLTGLKRRYAMGSSVVEAVRGVSLRIARRDLVGLVGVSGSGKSTLLHLLGGLDTPDSGSIDVFGFPLSQVSKRELTHYRRQMVGFVFQSFYLIPTLTAEQNVRLALTFQGVFGEERTRRAQRALEQVGLGHRMHHRPGQLSGGEQQRVTVARAIVHDPPLLLADEPTGNLDRKNADQLMELFRGIRDEMGTTVVIVSHDDALVSKYCDRVFRMSDGCLEPETVPVE